MPLRACALTAPPSANSRGADRPRLVGLRAAQGGHVCGLFMEAHPLHGHTFGVVDSLTPLVDLWVDIRGLPDHLRLALKPRE